MSSTLFIAILVIVALVVVFAVFVLLRKMKLGLKAAGHIAFWPVAIGCIFVFVNATSTYVVTVENGEVAVASMMGFGNATYDMSTGEHVDVEVPMGKCLIVNDCDLEMMVEAVVYGDGYVYEQDAYFEPRSYAIYEHTSIDYMPNEAPPETISSDKSGAEAKTWLHQVYELEDYEEE